MSRGDLETYDLLRRRHVHTNRRVGQNIRPGAGRSWPQLSVCICTSTFRIVRAASRRLGAPMRPSSDFLGRTTLMTAAKHNFA